MTRALQKTEQGWNEVLIDSNLGSAKGILSNPEAGSPSRASTSTAYPRLRRVLSPTPTAASTVLGLSSTRFRSLPVGVTIEVSPASFKIARQVGELLSRAGEGKDESSPGGCGLIVDYGGTKAFGDSFRVRNETASCYVF